MAKRTINLCNNVSNHDDSHQSFNLESKMTYDARTSNTSFEPSSIQWSK